MRKFSVAFSIVARVALFYAMSMTAHAKPPQIHNRVCITTLNLCVEREALRKHFIGLVFQGKSDQWAQYGMGIVNKIDYRPVKFGYYSGNHEEIIMPEALAWVKLVESIGLSWTPLENDKKVLEEAVFLEVSDFEKIQKTVEKHESRGLNILQRKRMRAQLVKIRDFSLKRNQCFYYSLRLYSSISPPSSGKIFVSLVLVEPSEKMDYCIRAGLFEVFGVGRYGDDLLKGTLYDARSDRKISQYDQAVLWFLYNEKMKSGYKREEAMKVFDEIADMLPDDLKM